MSCSQKNVTYQANASSNAPHPRAAQSVVSSPMVVVAPLVEDDPVSRQTTSKSADNATELQSGIHRRVGNL